MRLLLISTIGAVAVSALPGMSAELNSEAMRLLRRQGIPAVLPLSENEGNSGPFPSLTFNAADQFVDVRPGTTHEYRAPGPNDKRGPCPGLNAAANHGFLPRSGIPNIQQSMSYHLFSLSRKSMLSKRKLIIPEAITGLGQAYSFGPEFAAALAAVAVTLVGDPIAQTWSIGGPYPASLLGALLSNPEGISRSHNAYESDASPARVSKYSSTNNTFLNNG